MSTVHIVEWTQSRSELFVRGYMPVLEAALVGGQSSCSHPALTHVPCSLCRSKGRVSVLSLKVVVQRALIELPGSLRRRCSMEEKGEVGGPRRSDRIKKEAKNQDEADSELITCQSCDITVHKGQLYMTFWSALYPLLQVVMVSLPIDHCQARAGYVDDVRKMQPML